jgi:hypothetical protein
MALIEGRIEQLAARSAAARGVIVGQRFVLDKEFIAFLIHGATFAHRMVHSGLLFVSNSPNGMFTSFHTCRPFTRLGRCASGQVLSR